MRTALLLIVFLIFSFNSLIAQQSQKQTSVATKKSYTEKEKIELLIQSIEKLEGTSFYRNGSYYDAKTAADHLRMKWGKAGSAVKTARDFIDKVASKSSVSGSPYRIKFADGNEIETKIFLNQRLSEIEQKKH